MNLLELPDHIQNDLKNPPARLDISAFSEDGCGRSYACGGRESQLRRWQELVRECRILVRV